jgi:hypothetical protein
MAGIEGAVPINSSLVWDYEIPDAENQDEAFLRWYIARVLTRGRSEDVRAIGLPTIRAHLGHLVLPARIRRFWERCLSLPEVGECYGIADSATA